MEKQNARKLNKEAQQMLRNQVIRLRKAGKTYKEIGEILGMHTARAWQIYKAYERGGKKAITIKKRGRDRGSHRTLDADQEQRLKRAITDKTPDQLKFPFALWTRRAVQQLIQQLFSINMPIRTVGEYLKRWGFTPQKPLRRAYEQNPIQVQRWLDEQYPAIVAKAKKEDAEIHWGDKTGLCTDSQHGRGYTPKGQTLVIRLNAKHERINLISSITVPRYGSLYDIGRYSEFANIYQVCHRLIKDAGKKIYLILDNLRVHHSQLVKDWVQQNKDEIELFNLS